jgi:putative transposase
LEQRFSQRLAGIVEFVFSRFGETKRTHLRCRDPEEAGSAHRVYPQWRWHLDDVFVKINGKLCYLWRAVDHEGEVLETVVTAKRDKAAISNSTRRAT